MSVTQMRTFGRTGESVPGMWIDEGNGVVRAGDWLVLSIGPEVLDRRGEVLLKEKLDEVGIARADVVRVQDVLAGELKAGWPLHRLQRFRDTGLCRYVMIDTHDAREAEWIASNAPVHAVGVQYSTTDMAVRYRVFDIARIAGVALVGCATTREDVALQSATPDLTCVIAPQNVIADCVPLDGADVERLWDAYRLNTPAPLPLRGAHPPEFGA